MYDDSTSSSDDDSMETSSSSSFIDGNGCSKKQATTTFNTTLRHHYHETLCNGMNSDGTESNSESSDTEETTTCSSDSDNSDDELESEDDPEEWNSKVHPLDLQDLIDDSGHISQDNRDSLEIHSNRHQDITPKHTALITWLLYFILVWQTANYISWNAIDHLLRFLCMWMKCVFEEHPSMLSLYAFFPSSLYLMRKFLKLDRDDFQKFAVCPKCQKLYDFGECVEIVNGQTQVRLCNNIMYKRGRQRNRVCGSSLARKVVLSDGTKKFTP
ncbi:uncharacterized protein [Ptychodera flava]|uniref:uncharacterized protein n=1 Tax=Ptychodera flava TaxID=63121 RepID=UPI00396AA38A